MNKRILRAALCILLAFSVILPLSSCRSDSEKTTDDVTSTYFTDNEIKQKYKDSDGVVAYKIDYILPQMDDSKIASLANFNKIISEFEQEAESNAKSVIANKLYEKRKPWTVTATYEVTYASYNYVSVVIEFTQTTSAENVTTYHVPIVFSMSTYEQVGFDEFASLSPDYVKTQVAQAIINKITESGAAVPQLSVIQSSFDYESFALTTTGIDIYFKPATMLGYSDVADHYSFAFADLAEYFNYPNK